MYDILVFVVNSIGLKILNTSFVYESTKIVFEAVRSASEKLLAWARRESLKEINFFFFSQI